MRIIVCGSRTWTDREQIARVLVGLKTDPMPTIVHGDARGADRIAEEEAIRLGFPVEAHPADWHQYGKSAGPVRNEEMAKLGATICIAFWDYRSGGTKDMMNRAARHKIPIRIIPVGAR